MKPISVAFQCFGPYMDRQSIDFTQLEKNGLFLICGETGAGKTTILDAICYALYCESSGGQRGDLEHMRCKLARKEDETSVEYVFESGGHLYKFSRSMKYKTKNLHKYHNCYIWNGDEWELLDTGLGQVNARAERIVGLTSSQFRQVIVLPQGKFEEFLVSDSKKKEEILATLFDVQQWSRITEEISRRVNKRADGLNREKLALDMILRSHGCENLEELSTKRLAAVQELSELTGQLETAEREHIQAQNVFQEQLRIAQGYEELEKRKTHYEMLQSREAEIQSQTQRMLLADRAEQIREFHDGLKAARREAQIAAEQEKAAADGLQRNIRNLDAAALQLQSHLAQEPQMREKRQRIALLENSRQVYARLQSLAEAEQRAQKADQLARRRLAEETEKLEQKDRALALAFQEQSRAKELYSEAQLRYRRSIGGILAATLEEGKPCPVCGSTHHPAPVPGGEGHVSEEELDKLNRCCSRWDRAVSDAIGERARAEKCVSEARELYTAAHQKVAEAAAACRSAQEQKVPDIDSADALERTLAAQKRLLAKWETEGSGLLETQTAAEAARQAGEMALRTARDRLEEAQKTLTAAQESWQEACVAALFGSEQEYLDARMEPKQVQRIRDALAAHHSALEHARDAYESQREAMKDKPVRNLTILQQREEEASRLWRQLSQRRILLDSQVSRMEADEKTVSDRTERYRKDMLRLEEDQVFARRLMGSQGVGLQRYVLGVMMNAITVQANRLLSRVYSGRYSLYRTDETSGRILKGGLELEVYDSHNNQRRSVRTLSGGEKFLVALSLAIGLSAVVQAQGEGIRLEAMFIDEGFGSLDREAIQDALEILQGIQRTAGVVGIISHVDTLRETIPARIEIRKTGNGSQCRVLCP